MALTMLAILNPGDEVIVFSPYFAMYRSQIELAGGVCVDVPTYACENYAISEEPPARGNHAEDEGNHLQQPDESHRYGIWARDAGAAGKDRAGV